MPIDKYFKGRGRKVMRSMKSRYGEKEGERVFYATANTMGMNPRNRMAKSRRRMRDRSTAASPPMSTSEIMCGYRKLGGK